jgi:hypothetical protein
MKSTPFNTETDKAPISFAVEVRQFAKQLKLAGLKWQPHVGCFVWDEGGKIRVPSPFPENIYFILNLGHFVRLLGSIEDVANDMIWLPTWHQARIICKEFEISDQIVYDIILADKSDGSIDILQLYGIILNKLTK